MLLDFFNTLGMPTSTTRLTGRRLVKQRIVNLTFAPSLQGIVIEIKYQRTAAAYVSSEKVTEAIFVDV